MRLGGGCWALLIVGVLGLAAALAQAPTTPRGPDERRPRCAVAAVIDRKGTARPRRRRAGRGRRDHRRPTPTARRSATVETDEDGDCERRAARARAVHGHARPRLAARRTSACRGRGRRRRSSSTRAAAGPADLRPSATGERGGHGVDASTRLPQLLFEGIKLRPDHRHHRRRPVADLRHHRAHQLRPRRAGHLRARSSPGTSTSTCGIHLIPAAVLAIVVGGRHRRRCIDTRPLAPAAPPGHGPRGDDGRLDRPGARCCATSSSSCSAALRGRSPIRGPGRRSSSGRSRIAPQDLLDHRPVDRSCSSAWPRSCSTRASARPCGPWPTTPTWPPRRASTSTGSSCFVWALGGGLAALGGVLFGPAASRCSFEMGFQLLLLMFAGITLGGLGTAYGALVGQPRRRPVHARCRRSGSRSELKNVGALVVLDRRAAGPAAGHPRPGRAGRVGAAPWTGHHHRQRAVAAIASARRRRLRPRRHRPEPALRLHRPAQLRPGRLRGRRRLRASP